MPFATAKSYEKPIDAVLGVCNRSSDAVQQLLADLKGPQDR